MALIKVNIDTHPPSRATGHTAQIQDKVLHGNQHTNFSAAWPTPSCCSRGGFAALSGILQLTYPGKEISKAPENVQRSAPADGVAEFFHQTSAVRELENHRNV